jgi:hypothetical protein
MGAPFHAIHMLDPRMHRVGFAVADVHPGDACYGRAPWTSAAVIDVMTGTDWNQPMTPVVWPANGSSIRLTRFTGENPDPRLGCPGGADAWQGIPLIGMFAEPASSPSAYIRGPAGPVDVCLVTPANYVGPDATWTAVARSVMQTSNAVVVIPRTPLGAGVYEVGILSDAVPTHTLGSFFHVVP